MYLQRRSFKMKLVIIILVAIEVCNCSMVENLRVVLKGEEEANKKVLAGKNKPKSLIAITLSDLDVFDTFREKFNKKYYNDDDEEASRLLKLVANNKKIEEHNEKFSNGNSMFQMGLWEHADMAAEEIVNTMTGFIGTAKRKLYEDFNFPLVVPDYVNYTEEGMVSIVLEQGFCSGCWAFATLGALEGQIAKKTGNFVQLSEQNLIDCNKNVMEGNWGCNGGNMVNAYEYLLKINQGINSASAYPYKGSGEFNCTFDSNTTFGKIVSYVQLPPDENLLKLAVAHVGPIAVAVDASLDSFQNYQGGIYDDPACSQTINHAVLLVGYGTDPAFGDYWLVKNSWGPSYGENGYIRIARNQNNLCGIASEISYPVLLDDDN